MRSQFKLDVYKLSQRSLDESVMRKQIGYGLDRAFASRRGNTWRASPVKFSREEQHGEYIYKGSLIFVRDGREIPKEKVESQWRKVRTMLEAAIRSKGWSLNGSSPTKEIGRVIGEFIVPGGPVQLTPLCPNDIAYQSPSVKLPVEAGQHFSHLYSLDNQIELVLSAVTEYERSEYANRFHCLLYGEPACGKTEILRSLTRMLGTDAVMHFDATSTTSAGAKQLLTESARIPPVLCIEEIEKADEVSLRWLLGVLDYRAEVRALKFRQGLVSREIKLLCLATVNDMALFNRMMDGALASRFSHKIYCPRPSRQTLEMILKREVTKVNGNPLWIDAALDYCLKEEETNDPRRIITVCLCGRDRLLNGEYQSLLNKTRKPIK